MNAKPLEDFSRLNGTHGLGTIETTRGALVKAFGEPQYEELSGDKTTVEWDIEFEDGTIATVYDYKREDGGYYDGKGVLLDDFTEYDFSIGGNDPKAVELVKEALSKVPDMPKITSRRKEVQAIEYRLTFEINGEEWNWIGYLADNFSGSDWYFNGEPATDPEWAEDLDLFSLADDAE